MAGSDPQSHLWSQDSEVEKRLIAENTRLRLTLQSVLGLIENGKVYHLAQAERLIRDTLTVKV